MLPLNIIMAAVFILKPIIKTIQNVHILKTMGEVASFKIVLPQIHPAAVNQDQAREVEEEINPIDLRISVKHLFF